MWKVFEGSRGYDIHDSDGVVFQTAVRGPAAKKSAEMVVTLLNAAEAHEATAKVAKEVVELAPGLFDSPLDAIKAPDKPDADTLRTVRKKKVSRR